ncbi:hypothetical protein JG688_00016395 [Phytophthora aleatoria]|uniref:Uncharacterized protein n=1 Tax=Phytophthora aleatoria TaxID=2496075 RepID=A0A8J5MCW2_9STRA|nr:hypothetical protein JG688_00016395 [Phytophthora aleatoria]
MGSRLTKARSARRPLRTLLPVSDGGLRGRSRLIQPRELSCPQATLEVSSNSGVPG